MNLSSITKNYKIKLAIVTFVFLYLLLYFSQAIFVVVPPGSGGVLFNLLSNKSLSEKVYHEGLYIIKPWNKIIIYDTSIQKKNLEEKILTSNGLSVKIRISALFRPVYDSLPYIIKNLGPLYSEKILEPIILSAVREIIGGYRPESLYTTAVADIQQAILIEAQKDLADIPINIIAIIIENIELPKSINQAIEKKLQFQQENLEYEFRLDREKQEAERRKIEALGIKEAQEIIASSLSGNLLLWLGVKATSDVAQSKNSKIIMIGGGKNGLPIILNPEESVSEKEEITDIVIEDTDTK